MGVAVRFFHLPMFQWFSLVAPPLLNVPVQLLEDQGTHKIYINTKHLNSQCGTLEIFNFECFNNSYFNRWWICKCICVLKLFLPPVYIHIHNFSLKNLKISQHTPTHTHSRTYTHPFAIANECSPKSNRKAIACDGWGGVKENHQWRTTNILHLINGYNQRACA